MTVIIGGKSKFCCSIKFHRINTRTILPAEFESEPQLTRIQTTEDKQLHIVVTASYEFHFCSCSNKAHACMRYAHIYNIP